MSAATQTFTEVYSRSMENGDSECASAMLGICGALPECMVRNVYSRRLPW